MELIGTDAVIVTMATGADSAPAGLARGDARRRQQIVAAVQPAHPHPRPLAPRLPA